MRPPTPTAASVAAPVPTSSVRRETPSRPVRCADITPPLGCHGVAPTGQPTGAKSNGASVGRTVHTCRSVGPVPRMGAHLTGGASPQPERGVARSYSVAVPPPAAAPVLPLVAGTKQNRGRPATQWARILRALPGPVALGTRGNGGEEASRP